MQLAAMPGLLAFGALVVGAAGIILGFAHDVSLEHAPERRMA
jgi:hypothetical protein